MNHFTTWRVSKREKTGRYLLNSPNQTNLGTANQRHVLLDQVDLPYDNLIGAGPSLKPPTFKPH